MHLRFCIPLSIVVALAAAQAASQEPRGVRRQEPREEVVQPAMDPPAVVPVVQPARSEPPADDSGSPVPEPTTLFLVGTGLVGLALGSRRWSRTISARRA